MPEKGIIMNRYIIVSNRLPVTVSSAPGGFQYKKSIGGLATGLASIHSKEDSLWIGWPGISLDDMKEDNERNVSDTLLKDHDCIAVNLNSREIEEFYDGFCNETIWPLFHYMPGRTKYMDRFWKAYRTVNEKFYEKIKAVVKPDDILWIHDYQLFLLPQLIRADFPGLSIGFFLHIPFPSYEVYRLLPWRTEILNGILGADLIGFHTYDYVRHFFSSVKRLLRHDISLGTITLNDRKVHADVFPMGIDYRKYSDAVHLKEVKREIKATREETRDYKVILSVDRLDYTKGIPERIKAFKALLKEHERFRGKIILILIVAPSRTSVETYQELLAEINDLVSQTNGTYGTIGWVPIWFFNRSFGFDKLAALYNCADVLLVTPLRDGMNLVAKEYIAARNDNGGAVVVSDTAGVASELGEAALVNANNISEIVEALSASLEMPVDEQKKKLRIMQKRLKRYNIDFWTHDFVTHLCGLIKDKREKVSVKYLTDCRTDIISRYLGASGRLLLLDYDGTLKAFCKRPEDAVPDDRLISLLRRLSMEEKNSLVIISGRKKEDLESWFGGMDLSLVAAHGLWIKHHKGEWQMLEAISNDWMEIIYPILEVYTDRTPGSFIEEKGFSLAWHYRNCDPDLAELRIPELKSALIDITENKNLNVLEGHKVIEVKNNMVNKGRAAASFLLNKTYPFVLAVGDDTTDEDMFAALGEGAYTVKVGDSNTQARYFLDDVDQVRNFLGDLSKA